MLKTPNMGLWGWDLEKDKFSHEQLVSNFRAIDDHNHSPGRGAQLSGESLFPEAIEHDQIAKGAVDGTNVKEHSLGSEQIDGGFLPLGSIIAWYRQPGVAAEPGPNWCLCDGRSWSSIENDLGYTTGNVPDLRGKFIMGAAGLEAIGASGGSASVNLSHSHTVNAHTHEVGGHTHTIGGHSHIIQGHIHAIALHTHGIVTDGNHNHGFRGHDGLYYPATSRLVGTSEGFGPWPNVMHIAQDSPGGLAQGGVANNESDESMQITGAHAHGGATAVGGSGETVPNSPFNSSENAPFISATNASFVSGASATSTNSQLGSISTLPPYVELAYIIKIR